jgi:hypothetical protein
MGLEIILLTKKLVIVYYGINQIQVIDMNEKFSFNKFTKIFDTMEIAIPL